MKANEIGKVDREKYPYVALWKRPEQDISEELYFNYVEAKTYRLASRGGIERLSLTATIIVYGVHKFLSKDVISFVDGEELKIKTITDIKEMVNQRIKHLIVPKIIEQLLVLE